MFLQDPQRTAYDLNFSIADIPVRVHPLFWLVAVLMSRGYSERPVAVVVVVGVMFISILIHELGHALAIRYYGWTPSITLYAFGGFASYNQGFSSASSSYTRSGNSTQAQVIIAAAGPIAGFAFAAFVAAGLFLSNSSVEFSMTKDFHPRIGMGPAIPVFVKDQLNLVWVCLASLFYVNIGWGIINLFPVFPLDGGRIARELMVAAKPQDGHRHAIILSIVAAIFVAVVGYAHWDRRFLAIMFAFLAYSNYNTFQAYYGGGHGGYGSRGPW